MARRLFDEEIERIQNRHLGDEFDFNTQLAHRLGKHTPGLSIVEPILLPIGEVLPARDSLGIAQNAGPTVRCRSQANHVRPVSHQTVVGVMRFMM